MWIQLAIFLLPIARGEESLQLHPKNKLPPESGKITRPFLEVICKEKIRNGIDEFDRRPICTSPPPFVGESPLPGQFGILRVYLGHFSSPGAEEALLATSGGEPHAANFGGTALLERKNGSWEFSWYRSGVITSDCAKVKRKDATELLVCFIGDVHQGVISQNLYLIDPTKPKDSDQTTLLALMDDTSNCGGYLNPNSAATVRHSEFKDISISADGNRLTASVDFGVRKYSAAERSACSLGINKNLKIPAALAPESKSFVIQFDWNGTEFRLQPDSVKSKTIVSAQDESQ